MICQKCRDGNHARCIDIYWGPALNTGERAPLIREFDNGVVVADEQFMKPGRRYRSCNCQHQVITGAASRGEIPADLVVEPATGPAGE